MSKIKTKITKWEYVTEPFGVLVLPALVKRTHSPLERSLSPHYTNGEFYLHLRSCVQGKDENGVVHKYLYCTRDGRFFVRGKNGWNEEKPNDNLMRRGFGNKASGGGYDAPRMQHFGGKYCHRCVAFAWLDIPKDVKLQMIGVDAPTKWEVDHLNTDHKNWTADNLQWVTADENRRRGEIARQLRKAAIDPKLLTPTLCRGIYTLNQYQLDVFFNAILYFCNQDPTPLSIDAIRLDVARALDSVKEQPNPIFNS